MNSLLLEYVLCFLCQLNATSWGGYFESRFAPYPWMKSTKHSVEMRLFLSTLEADALQAMHAVRAHWGIENRVHWHDVTKSLVIERFAPFLSSPPVEG